MVQKHVFGFAEDVQSFKTGIYSRKGGHDVPPAALRPNDLLSGGRYKVKRLVKSGGMGTVYEVDDLRLKKRWAVKSLSVSHLPVGDQQQMFGLFDREVRILADLRHPSIPIIVDYFEEFGAYNYVMDFIDGQNFEELMTSAGHTMPVEQTIQWG